MRHQLLRVLHKGFFSGRFSAAGSKQIEDIESEVDPQELQRIRVERTTLDSRLAHIATHEKQRAMERMTCWIFALASCDMITCLEYPRKIATKYQMSKPEQLRRLMVKHRRVLGHAARGLFHRRAYF